MATAAPHPPSTPHDHVVHLYDADEHLVADVCRYIADGLGANEGVVVISTPAHELAFRSVLSEQGIELQVERDAGRYHWLDAVDTLSLFMVDGALDPERFRSVIGGHIAQASAGGRTVRAFGEMVAVLWDDGNVVAAIELESLWNQLADDHRFSLYCAYPMHALVGGGDLEAIHQVCTQHSDLIAPRSYREGAAVRLACEAPDERSLVLIPDLVAVRSARSFVADTLRAWEEHALVDDASLVVSELATNAVVHAGSPFRVTISHADGIVSLAVQDTSAEPVQPRAWSGDAIGGRGIAVVQELSVRWGVEFPGSGKTVWAEFATSA